MKGRFARHAMYALYVFAGAATLALTLPGVSAAAAHRPAGTPHWLVADIKKHTATITLIANYNSAVSGGYNFNGDGNGKMVISVPAGYKVTVIFTNKGALPHSAVITAYNKRNSTSGYTPAFHGASTTNPTSGTAKGKTERFTFVANKVGKYAIVCAVPGHETIGMWDVFQVTHGGKATIKM